jgi:hypothetical protein
MFEFVNLLLYHQEFGEWQISIVVDQLGVDGNP